MSVPADSPARASKKRGFGARRWRLLKWTLLVTLGVVVLVVGFVFLFPQTAKRWSTQGMEELLPRYLAWNASTGRFTSHLASRQEVKSPMRDGIQLATDAYLPSGDGPFPTIALRTPYAKADGRLIGDFFARYGYAVAVQDVRGRFASEGEFYPFRAEVDDGASAMLENSFCEFIKHKEGLTSAKPSFLVVLTRAAGYLPGTSTSILPAVAVSPFFCLPS